MLGSRYKKPPLPQVFLEGKVSARTGAMVWRT